MIRLIFISILLFFCLNLTAQVKTVPTKFDPIEEINLPGVTIIGSPTIVGKEINITDVDDASNMTIIIRTPSSDTSNNPTYPNLLTLGSIMKIKTNNITTGDTVFIREDGLGVNGIVGAPGYPITKNIRLDFVYTTVGWVEKKPISEVVTYVDSYSEINNRSFSANDVIIVKTANVESRYKVSNDSINGIIVNSARGVLSTGNNKYALLQPKNDYIDVCDFGAFPASIDNGEDDTEINQAIQYALFAEFPTVAHSLKGEYDIDDPIIIAKRNGIEYDFAELELRGFAPTYGIGGDNNYISYDCNENDIPGIIVQRARHTYIRDINISGDLPTEGFADLISQESLSSRLSLSGHRSNRYSPHAGIVIDPFDDKVGVVTGGADQYPGLSSWYGNTNDGGSSHVTIEGVAIRGFGIALAHNPSFDIQNGDNVKLINATIENCYAGWATGQGQSKGNVFRDIYSLGVINVLIDCKSIGTGTGAPPFFSDSNIAGSVARVVDAVTINTSFLHIRSTFMESVASIGRSNITTLIESCRFSFAKHDSRNVPGSDYIYQQSGNQATFKNCDFAYFTNGGYQYPLLFIENGGNIKLEDCYLDSGPVLSRLWAGAVNNGTNAYLNGVNIENCTRYTVSGEVGYNEFSTYNKSYAAAYNYAEEFPWEEVRIELSSPLPSVSNPYLSPTITISVSNADDEILVNDIVYMKGAGPPSVDPTRLLGLVTTVNTNSIVVTGVPYNYMDSRVSADTNNIYLLRANRSMDRAFGDLMSGNDTIKNIYNISAISVGDYVNTPSGNLLDQINANCRVMEKGVDWVRLSRAASGNEGKALIMSRPYKKRRVVDNTDDRFNGQSFLSAWYVGDEMLMIDKDTSVLVCTKSGVYGTDWEPEFKPIGKNSYADENLLDGGTGGTFDPVLTLDSNLIINGSQVIFEDEDGTDRGALVATEFQFGNVFNDAVGFTTGLLTLGKAIIGDTLITNSVFVNDNSSVIISETSDVVDENDQEFKVSFGRDKGQETDVDFNLSGVLVRSGHLNFEYTSKITSSASSDNVIWLDTLTSEVKHMSNIFITGIDSSSTHDIKIRTANGDSLMIRDTTISTYLLDNYQTIHIKGVRVNGKIYYKILNPDKIGAYVNTSGGNESSVTITHNLGATPTLIDITANSNVGSWYISNRNPNTFTVDFATPLANTEGFQWHVNR